MEKLDGMNSKVLSSADIFQACVEEFLPFNSYFGSHLLPSTVLVTSIAASHLQGRSVSAREQLLSDLVLFTVAAFQHILCASRSSQAAKLL